MELHHHRFERITINPEVCLRKPCIRGLRIPVASVLSYLSSGMNVAQILNEWPELGPDDIQQALATDAAIRVRILPIREGDE